VFDILLSSDAYVPDHASALAQTSRELAIAVPPERHWTRSPGQGIEYSWVRLNRDRSIAPTLLEFLADLPGGEREPPGVYDGVPEIAASQGNRPARLHATPVGVADVGELAERLERHGVAFRLAEPSEHFPFPRVWVGYRGGRPDCYESASDGGARLEFLPTDTLGLPDGQPTATIEVAEGTPVRITARTILVTDLEATARTYDTVLGWAPEQAPQLGPDGVLRGVWRPGFPRSGALDLAEARGDGPEARFLAEYGPGAYATRFAVRGLPALADRLRTDGVPVEELATGRLLRPVDRALGTAFEFEEWDGS
jgi:catechol 2,3-dioxygenase-like lactoylglutathione lyase family enzyme